MLILDADGRIRAINPAAEEIFGATNEALQGARLSTLCHPDDADLFAAAVVPTADPLARRLTPFRFLAAGSVYRWIEWHLGARTDSGQALAVGRDVAGTLAKERAFLESPEATALLANPHVCIAILDRDLRFRHINLAYSKAAGVSPESVYGRNHFELYPDEENERLFRRVVETGTAYHASANRFEHPNLGTGYWDWSLTPFRNRDKRIGGVVLALVNVTDREEATRSLRRQSDRFATILATSRDGYWLMDPQGNLEDVNQAYCDMTGYTREELVHMHIADLEANETPDDIALHIQKVFRSGFDRFESRHRRKDGTIMEVEVSASYWSPTGQFLAFIRDITEQRETERLRQRSEAKLREARQLAEQASREKTRFLATASHDLRQPIQALHLLSHLLVNSELPSATAEIANRIQAAVEGLGKMMDTLLDISKLDAGLVKPELAAFCLDELLRQLCDEYRPLAEQKGIALHCHPGSVWVHSDRHLLGRILRNLISNAIKYTPSGRIVVGVRRQAEQVRIQVLDTGVGFDQGEVGEIFREFRQLGNPARDRREGLGLGLTIVKRLCDLLGHPLEATSTRGRGSCFSVSVPLGTDDKEAPAEPSSPRPKTRMGAEILVVDDEIDIRESLEMILRSWGYSVTTAVDFDGAIAAARAHAPRLVIADYRLGGKTGTEVIEAIRRHSHREVAALMLTGDATAERAREAARLGLKLLRKPVAIEPLRDAIADALKGGRSDS